MDGIQLWSIIADNVVLMDQLELDEGSALSPFVTIGSNVRIGKCFQANLYSYVEHDCVIGDFVTFAPGVKCNGNIHIHAHAYIGAGAMIKQGTPISHSSLAQVRLWVWALLSLKVCLQAQQWWEILPVL